MDGDALRRVLGESWGLAGAVVEPLDGGMTSRTWSVRCGRDRWVLKAVPAAGLAAFEEGLAVAARLDGAGIAAGAPRPARAGGVTAGVALGGAEWVAALLAWVDGEPLTGGTGAELRLIGRTLGAAHRALGEVAVSAEPAAVMRPVIDLSRPHLDLRPWIRPAVARALAAVTALGPGTLTWGPIHGDPAPEAFRHAGPGAAADDGVCGLIDWGAAGTAPRMFDLASAVMYAGGPARAEPLVAAYVGTGAVGSAEAGRALLPMLGYRWAVQADFFAWRIAEDVRIGVGGAADNEKGLADACRGLAEFAGSGDRAARPAR